MRILSLVILLSIAGLLQGQVGFKTVVPPQAVTAGESFQVQYIIEGGEQVSQFLAPVFTNFRIVSGPNIYYGSGTPGGTKQLRNTVYTLEAIRPGQYVIPGAVATVNGELVRSPNAVITVITQEETLKRFDREAGLNSGYFLKPGEDPYRKIAENLFLKVLVDKTDCFAGEAVLATYKLYSRLESKSDIVKNPGFYGFSVDDIINLSDRFVSTENLNGRVFDVHTIRKVRLFPLQAGIFTIDPMEIRNKVEFSRSAVYHKTEQQIVEGVLNNAEERPRDRHSDVYETDMRSDPVTIRVKPLPVEAKPASYNGAVGSFTVSMELSDTVLARNQTGYLDIRVSGDGNFIQLDAPEIQWPAGVEGFPPKVLDVPGNGLGIPGGSRVFRYAFLSAAAGVYEIPPLTFSFFNPDSGRYHTLLATGKHLRVNNMERSLPSAVVTTTRSGNAAGRWVWPVGILCAVLIAGVITRWILLRNRKIKQPVTFQESEPESNVSELLVLVLLQEGAAFYTALRKVVFDFFEKKYGFSGSSMNKEHISMLMRGQQVGEDIIAGIRQVIETCEEAVFTKATLTDNKRELVERTRTLLQTVQAASL